jgi:hypothetical protein
VGLMGTKVGMSPAARLLARLMSDLSEEYWCAGWLIDCEYALWAELTGERLLNERGWGISDEEKEELRLLQETRWRLDYLVGRERWPVFLPMEEWRAHLASRRRLQEHG